MAATTGSTSTRSGSFPSPSLIPVPKSRVPGEPVKIGGLTLTDLAAKTGLTLSYLSRVFRGRKTPRIETLNLIAQAAKLDPGQLLDALNKIPKPVKSKGKSKGSKGSKGRSKKGRPAGERRARRVKGAKGKGAAKKKAGRAVPKPRARKSGSPGSSPAPRRPGKAPGKAPAGLQVKRGERKGSKVVGKRVRKATAQPGGKAGASSESPLFDDLAPTGTD